MDSQAVPQSTGPGVAAQLLSQVDREMGLPGQVVQSQAEMTSRRSRAQLLFYSVICLTIVHFGDIRK